MANKEEEKILKITVRYDDALEGIRKYKQELVDLKEEEDNLKVTDEDYTDQLELINAKRKEAQAEIRVLRREIQNNIKIQREQEGSLRQLRAALSNATKEYDELSRAERNSARGEELKNHINDITKELKGAEEETQRFYRNVGNYKNSILEALGVNSGFAETLTEMTQNGSGVNGFLDEASVKVKSFGKALLALLTNPVFLAIAGIAGVGVAFKWWYDYNKGVEEATRKTRALFKEASGSELKELRNQIQALADLYKQDFQEVLMAVNTLVKQFGIDGSEATKLIAEGFALDANIGGEFLEVIKEYSVQFKAAGMSASEFIAFTVEASKQGIFSDKAFDAVKEAMLRIREMPQATQDAMRGIGLDVDAIMEQLNNGSLKIMDVIKMVSTRMSELEPTSQRVGAVIADVFGGAGEDAGEEYLATIKDISTNLSQVKTEAGQFYDINMQIYDSEVKLKNTVSQLFDATDGGFERLRADLQIAVNEFLVEILTYLQNFVNLIKDINNATKVFTIIGKALRTILDVFTAIDQTIKSISASLQFLFNWDVDKWADKWNKAGANIENAFVDIWRTWTTGWSNAEKETMDGMNRVEQKARNIVKKTGWGNWLKGVIDDNSKAKTKEGIEEEIRTLERLANRFDLTTQASERLANAIKSRKDALALLGKGGNQPTIKEEIADEYKTRKQEIEERAKLIEEKLRVLTLGVEQEYKLKQEALELERQQRIMAINEEYQDERRRLEALELLNIEYANKRVAIETEKNERVKTEQNNFFNDALAQSTQWTQDIIKQQQDKAKEEEDIERKRNSALMTLSNSMSAFAQAAAKENEKLAGMAKALAIAEVLIAQGVAIANAVKNATKSGVTIWDTIALIGVAIGAVTSVMATAMDSINRADVGGGSGSASSGGASATFTSSAVYNPILEQMNSLGSGVTTYQGGGSEQVSEAMIADATARGVASQPAPVVSVVEITEAQDRVRAIENIGTM